MSPFRVSVLAGVLCLLGVASAGPGSALAAVRVTHKTAKTKVLMSASKDPEGNVTASISLSSPEATCLNAGRLVPLARVEDEPVSSPVSFGYGSELVADPEPGAPKNVEPSGGSATSTKSGTAENLPKIYFALNQASTPGVSPWVLQESWPAALQTEVFGNGPAPFTSTIAESTFVHLRVALYLHRKVTRRGNTKEILSCPGREISRWLPL